MLSDGRNHVALVAWEQLRGKAQESSTVLSQREQLETAGGVEEAASFNGMIEGNSKIGRLGGLAVGGKARGDKYKEKKGRQKNSSGKPVRNLMWGCGGFVWFF